MEKMVSVNSKILHMTFLCDLRNDDDALDIFKKALPSAALISQQRKSYDAFLQTSGLSIRATKPPGIQDARTMIAQMAKKHPSAQYHLLLMALTGEERSSNLEPEGTEKYAGQASTVVTGMVDSMVHVLHDEDVEDEHKKDFCHNETQTRRRWIESIPPLWRRAEAYVRLHSSCAISRRQFRPNAGEMVCCSNFAEITRVLGCYGKTGCELGCGFLEVYLMQEFDKKLFLQKIGAAMGSRCIPNYANIFMSKIDKMAINAAALFGEGIRPIRFYKRFLDDIFTIWLGSVEDLENFLDLLNTLHPTIKFS